MSLDACTEKKFLESIEFLNKCAREGKNTTDSEKLRLYGFYKQATQGKCESGQPSELDPVSLTKWRAWRSTNLLSRQDSMKGYVETVEAFSKRSTPKTESTSMQYDSTGYLFKKLRGKWTKKYFKLEGMMLLEFRSTSDHYPVNVMVIQGCQVNLIHDLSQCTPDGVNLYLIRLFHPDSDNEMILAASSLLEAKKWVDILRVSKPTTVPSIVGRAAEEDIHYETKFPDEMWREFADRFELPLDIASIVGQTVQHAENRRMDESWNELFVQDGVHCFQLGDASMPSAMGKTMINAPMMAITNTLWDLQRRSVVDSLYHQGETLESFGTQTRIDHLEYKPYWPFQGRDFCNVTHWRMAQDGRSCLLLSTSTQHPRCPEKPGLVRGTVKASCFFMQHISSHVTEVTYLIETEPMGSIPVSFVRNFMTHRPMILHQLKKTMEEIEFKCHETVELASPTYLRNCKKQLDGKEVNQKGTSLSESPPDSINKLEISVVLLLMYVVSALNWFPSLMEQAMKCISLFFLLFHLIIKL